MSRLYQIRHVTRYRYEHEISENVMEVRKCPLNRPNQRLISFKMEVEPAAKLFRFEESNGNVVYHFDIPQRHQQMMVAAEALIEVKDGEAPPWTVPTEAWSELAGLCDQADFLEYSLSSPLVQPSQELHEYYQQVAPRADEDAMTFLRRLNQDIAAGFEYVPMSTQVDSSVDEALEKRQGVCQDFAHIMLGVARLAKIPARYISGYLFHREDDGDRSCRDASHAWVEAYLPSVGWVGFDPTNNIIAGERHIVNCTGRDYKDVPPTRGVYRGQCPSELSVAVQVHPADSPHAADEFRRMDESDLKTEEWVDPRAAEQAQ